MSDYQRHLQIYGLLGLIWLSWERILARYQEVVKPLAGAKQITRSENRTKEITLRTNDIRIAPTPEEIEKYVRYLPGADQLPKAKQKAPSFLRNMISDFSRDLGDQDHIFSNISQAAKIYRNSGMSEETFIQVLYEARATAKRATQIRHVNSHGGMNRMPYFFRCLNGLIGKKERLG